MGQLIGERVFREEITGHSSSQLNGILVVIHPGCSQSYTGNGRGGWASLSASGEASQPAMPSPARLTSPSGWRLLLVWHKVYSDLSWA